MFFGSVRENGLFSFSPSIFLTICTNHISNSIVMKKKNIRNHIYRHIHLILWLMNFLLWLLVVVGVFREMDACQIYSHRQMLLPSYTNTSCLLISKAGIYPLSYQCDATQMKTIESSFDRPKHIVYQFHSSTHSPDPVSYTHLRAHET